MIFGVYCNDKLTLEFWPPCLGKSSVPNLLLTIATNPALVHSPLTRKIGDKPVFHPSSIYQIRWHIVVHDVTYHAMIAIMSDIISWKFHDDVIKKGQYWSSVS